MLAQTNLGVFPQRELDVMMRKAEALQKVFFEAILDND
jgi:hypothetical protein